MRDETFGVSLDWASLELDLERQTQLIILGQSFVDGLELAREVGEINSPFLRASLSCFIIAGGIITEKVILLRLPEVRSPKIISLCDRCIPCWSCKERLRHLQTSVDPTLRCFRLSKVTRLGVCQGIFGRSGLLIGVRGIVRVVLCGSHLIGVRSLAVGLVLLSSPTILLSCRVILFRHGLKLCMMLFLNFSWGWLLPWYNVLGSNLRNLLSVLLRHLLGIDCSLCEACLTLVKHIG